MKPTRKAKAHKVADNILAVLDKKFRLGQMQNKLLN